MSDLGPPTDLAAATAGFEAALEGGSEEPTGIPAEPASEQAADAIGQVGTQQGFTPGELKRYQDEAARYRTQLREEQSVWSGLHPDDARFIRETIAMASSDPQAAAARWAQITAAFAQPQTPPPAPEPLTRSDLEKFFQEREEQIRERQQVEQIAAEAQSLGFERGTPQYDQFLTFALNQHGGDLAAAHADLKQRAADIEKAAIDRYVASQKAKAGITPTVPNTAGQSGQAAPTAPTSIEEASALLRSSV